MPIRKSLPHIIITSGKTSAKFRPVTPPFGDRPPLTARQQRFLHATKLNGDIDSALETRNRLLSAANLPANTQALGICLDVESSPELELDFDALENRQGAPIELLNVRETDAGLRATIFVPTRRLNGLKGKVTKYGDVERDPNGTQGLTLSIDSVEAFKLSNLSSFWIDSLPLPTITSDPLTWEIWLRKGNFDLLQQNIERLPFTLSRHCLKFQECEICLVHCTQDTLSLLQLIKSPLIAFRHREQTPGFFARATPVEQIEWTTSFLAQLHSSDENAPAVCILDTGVLNTHALLVAALPDRDCDTVEPNWGKFDEHGHGTAVAGLALYGDLAPLLASTDPIELSHKLESVKILPNSGENPEELYGWITSEAISRAITAAPHRKRVICLAVTNSTLKSLGRPTAWSAAVDKIAVGSIGDIPSDRVEPVLFVVSVGNIRDNLRHDEYHSRNDLESVENPSQAWNALSVGGYTEKMFSEDEDLGGWRVICDSGEISFTSRTSIGWLEKDWPNKPDLVMEAGNWVTDGQIPSEDDDLSLLTTGLSAPLVLSSETSAAAAQVARFAAIVQAQNLDYWPETIRGLLVHSARWHQSMYRGHTSLSTMSSSDKQNLLRRFGYGTPNLQSAQFSSSNRTCLIIQSEIQPFNRQPDSGSVSYSEINHHKLPWPETFLADLGAIKIKVRVTLSYFIEPNPAERIVTNKYSYASHGLRFDLKRPLESEEIFLQRNNARARPPRINEGEENLGFDAPDTHTKWQLGPYARNKGSIVSDVWTGTAIELSVQNYISIIPEGGWWKYRKHLNRSNEKARYALIVSLECDDTEIDLYAAIENVIRQQSEVLV